MKKFAVKYEVEFELDASSEAVARKRCEGVFREMPLPDGFDEAQWHEDGIFELEVIEVTNA